MSGSTISLDELRVLVVEDELLISMMLEEMLEDFGCTVVGPCADLQSALQSCEAADFDVALIDMNLGGAKATPILEALDLVQIPYALATGADAVIVGEAPRLQKPYNLNDLRRTLQVLADRKR